MADKIADKSDGLNYMLVYCDKIEHITFGFETKNLLLTVPIPWHNQGSSEIGVYSPVGHVQKLQVGYHTPLSI